MESIIKDGVNVAECKELHIKEGYAENCDLTNCPCWQNPNCYFKQLQRAKAELEQYKKSKQASYETMEREWNAAINEYRKIIAENERLKEEITHWSGLANEANERATEYGNECGKLEEEISELKAENEKLKSRNKLYKKVIVENQQKFHNQIMILKACIKGEFSVDDFKNFAKVIDENKRLKADNNKMKDFIKWLFKQQYYILHQNIKEKIKELILTLSP